MYGQNNQNNYTTSCNQYHKRYILNNLIEQINKCTQN